MEDILSFKIGKFKNSYKLGMDFYDTKLGMEKSALNKLRLAYEEVFVNVIKANENSGADVTVRFTLDDERVEICIRDNGIEFNPLIRPDPDVTLPASKRGIGGLGIYLFKNITDYSKYEYIDGFNTLTFGKMLNEKE